MIPVKFNANRLMKDLDAVLKYSEGFLDGAKAAKPIMMKNISYKIKEAMYEYIDSMARVDPSRLHHVYEWYQTGNSSARLFDLQCTVSDSGIRFSYDFTQSSSLANGSSVPFYNKASIMESGAPVTIKPVNAKALSFEMDGEQIFTKKAVEISNPGGDGVQFGFASTIDTFLNSYLSQTFIDVAGLDTLDRNKAKFNPSKTKGRSDGFNDGHQWVAKVGTIG